MWLRALQTPIRVILETFEDQWGVYLQFRMPCGTSGTLIKKLAQLNMRMYKSDIRLPRSKLVTRQKESILFAKNLISSKL